MSKRICVVGGGVMGLTVAYELAQRKLKVSVLEGAPDFGGLARPIDFESFTWDRFYHCIVRTDSELLGLIDEIGLGDQVRWESTESGFLFENQMHSLNGIKEFLSFRPITLVDRFRLGLFIVACRHIFSGNKLESMSCEPFLRRWCGRRVYERVWEPLLSAKLGSAAGRVSARFIWDSINRLQGARKGMKKNEELGYVAGGYARILESLLAKLEEFDVQLRPSTPVKSIRAGSNANVEVTTANQVEFYDQVFVTVHNRVAAQILPVDFQHRDRLLSIEYLGVVVAAFVLQRPVSPFYILNISDPEIDITGVIGTSNLVKDGTFNGKHLVYLPRYLVQDDSMWDLSEFEWENYFREQLALVMPSLRSEDVLSLKISKARFVQPVLKPDYKDWMPPVSSDMEGVWLLNSSQCFQGPVNVNTIVDHARAALRSYPISSSLTGGANARFP